MGGKTVSVNGFPGHGTANLIKEFLENKIGKGTIYALKFRKCKKLHSSAFAIVQFTETCFAEKLRRLARDHLFYYDDIFLLKVSPAQRDIVPRPKCSLFEFQNTTLHFGSLISEHQLSVLCNFPNVDVIFEAKMRKINFFLSSNDCSYKLELNYESIWEIQLHDSDSYFEKCLLFLVIGAPKIYEKQVRMSGNEFDDPDLNYFKLSEDDQWIRSTDFTANSCIGQSSTFCFDLPYHILPAIGDYFVYYKEVSNAPLLKKKGLPYSYGLSQNGCGLHLVPIVQPLTNDIPFKILFKINSMIQNAILSGPTINDNFFQMVSPHLNPINFIECALEELSYSKSCCYNPVKWLHDRYLKYKNSTQSLKSTSITLDSALVYVNRVQITPCKMYFNGPEINVSNRILRKYPDDLENFLRISFIDEDFGKLYSADLGSRMSLKKIQSIGGLPSDLLYEFMHISPSSSDLSPQKLDIKNRTGLYKRILSTLKNGITVGSKKFEFLAFSSSQLRDSSAWMFASRNGLSAASIRADMGDFSKIHNVAKYAARLGQSFSSSIETLCVSREEVCSIRDVENSEGYVFSDGIGKISPEFAKRVANKCSLKSSTPSAFQIRYGGYKGVVAVDPTSKFKLSLRKSMLKFESDSTTLDVLAYSKYQSCFLNRQVITLLSTLGIEDTVFENKQKEIVDLLDKILTDPVSAEEVVGLIPHRETANILKEMLFCGYKPDEEPFLSASLQIFRAAKLLDLRTKARILIPMGRAMMGCLDETRTLEYGEVFVQISSYCDRKFQHNNPLIHVTSETNNRPSVITGKIVVAKNPCLHPGDLRILIAIDVPQLHHMVDCVVFPQKGHRPHPNECSGSDLDGDIYFVSWDPSIIPLRQVSPMQYDAAPSNTLDHDVTIEEVHEYFTNYIVNDSLGIISNAHTVFADKEPLKAESQKCIELAKLFSTAVDFPKTGVPAEIPQELQVSEYPDFMAKGNKPTYISKGIIGKLYRNVKNVPNTNKNNTFTEEVAEQSFDDDMLVPGYKDYLNEAFIEKEEYDFKLGNTMDHYGIKTEAEFVTGNVMKLSRSFNKYKDGEVIGHALKSLRKEVRAWFKRDEEDPNALESKASACYYVTYHRDYFGLYNKELGRPHFISFPWCLYDTLIQIKRCKIEMRKNWEFERQRRRMEMGLRL